MDGVGMNVLIVRTLAEYEELAVLIASRKHLHHVRSACCMSYAACCMLHVVVRCVSRKHLHHVHSDAYCAHHRVGGGD